MKKDWSDFNIVVPSSVGALGDAYTTCPECGPKRKKQKAKPLSINTIKLCWKCHHCGWTGSLYSGEEKRGQVDRWRPQVYARPEYAITKPTNPLIEFFKDRKISTATLERHRITLQVEWMPQVEDRVECICFPYYRDDNVINIKYRGLKEKHFRQVADAEKILYGLPDVATTHEMILCEGEIDKLSFYEAGLSWCASVPDGAPAENAKPTAKKFEYLENCEAVFADKKKIILATDGDGPGLALQNELARRLGPERCWKVHWPTDCLHEKPCKDANDVLKHHGPDRLREVIDAATAWPIEGIVRAVDLAEEIITYYHEGQSRGLTTGWSHLDEYYTIRTGELAVVTGIPSHGKSEWLDDLMINIASIHGWIFAICSPENRPLKYHMTKLIEKITGQPFWREKYGTPRLQPKAVVQALDWIQQHIIFIDPEEGMTIPALLEKSRALVYREGINGLIIDPWNEFDHTRPSMQSETEYVSKALSLVKQFNRKHQITTWIVAHPQKLQKDSSDRYPTPTPYDISGSANWFNKPDVCIAVWRDVHSEDHYSEVHIQKVRRKETGHVGNVGFLWSPVSGRYNPTDLRER